MNTIEDIIQETESVVILEKVDKSIYVKSNEEKKRLKALKKQYKETLK